MLFAQRGLCNKEVHKIMSKVHLYPLQITFQLPCVYKMKKAMFHHIQPPCIYSVLSHLFFFFFAMKRKAFNKLWTEITMDLNLEIPFGTRNPHPALYSEKKNTYFSFSSSHQITAHILCRNRPCIHYQLLNSLLFFHLRHCHEAKNLKSIFK